MSEVALRGVSPGRLALRRVRRNRGAIAAAAVFALVVIACLAAPLWADHVAHTSASANHLTDTVDGENVVSPEGLPIGPTWKGRFFLGADGNGRDIMVRLLYGGRTSLQIGFGAAILTCVLAVLVALVSGWYRGWVDALLARLLDVVWAYPVVLLGIALGTALALGGLQLGPIEVAGDSKLIPLLIIGFVYVPYMARPLRGQVLALREREFVDAARVQGAGSIEIMARELLPNLVTTIIVFFPLMVANAVLLEASLSFLGAGVQAPTPSWGTMLSDGTKLITGAPHMALVPGAMLVVCLLALNVLGDCLRDALDPRARLRAGAR